MLFSQQRTDSLHHLPSSIICTQYLLLEFHNGYVELKMRVNIVVLLEAMCLVSRVLLPILVGKYETSYEIC